MNEIDERNSAPTEGSSPVETPRPSRKRKPVSRAAAEKGFKAKFAAFMRNLNDPGYFRKKRLPDPSEYPEGQVPLWVSDPDHYEKKKSKTRRFFSVFGTVCLHLFLIFCMIGVVVLGVGAAVVYSFSDTELDERFASMDLDQSSFIYATNPQTGETYVYQEIQSTSGRRMWVSDAEIPQHVKDATVAVEDKRFYSHMGVDPIRTANAVLEYAMGILQGSSERSSGGSTLTQQVIKNMTGDDEYGISRKVKEMLQALYIERRYDKDQILEYYLNTVYFGNSANGISAAADVYFGKDVSELTVVEGAAIVAITKSPSYYDPVKNPENNKERRNTVLWMMHEQGYITREEYDEFSVTELNLVIGSDREDDNKTEDGILLYNYYSDMVIRDVLADLQAAGYSEAEANRLLYYGGLQIYACVDPDVQGIMEDYFVYDDNYYTASELKNLTAQQRHDKYAVTVGEGDKAVVELPQVSMMVMDPDTGDILGIIGGRGEKTKSLELNRATSTLRQPGSSIKPLSIYGYAIENNILALGSPIDDVPVETRKNNNYTWPSNYDGSYSGIVSMKKALSWSLNTTAARGLKAVGVNTSFDFLRNSLHITTLVDEDKASLAPLSVGALTNGVTLREMTTAYTVFAGDGMYTKYRSYSRVVSHDGKPILDNTVEREAVFSAETAFLITDVLKAALNTGGSSDPAKLKNIETAGKSGTTSFFKDRWFIGYTPEYLGGIWWGYDTPNTLENTHHVTMWNEVMTAVHERKQIHEAAFREPSGVKYVRGVCWRSGKLATSLCYSDGCVEDYWYKNDNVPSSYCDVHHELNVCTVSGKIAHEGCPSVTKKVFIDIDRTFNFSLYIRDAGKICPRLTEKDVLFADGSLPVYTKMLPDGLYPSYSSGAANCICTAHAPSATPHYKGGSVTPPSVTDPVIPPVSTDTDTPTDTGTSSDSGTPTDTTTDTGTDTGTSSDTGTSTDTGTGGSGGTSDET